MEIVADYFPVLHLELCSLIACYLKRRQTIANSTMAMIVVPAKKALWKLISRITINSAEPGVCFPCKIDSRSSSFFSTKLANLSAAETNGVG